MVATSAITQRAYIPQFQFDRIGMLRPAILSTLESDCMNPLYGYMTQENIQAWYNNFQSMGRQAVQWICAARDQSAQFSLYLGWNWDTFPQDVASLEFPHRYLIKGSEGMLFPLNFFSSLTKHEGSFSYVLPSVHSPSISDSSSDSGNESVTLNEDVVMNDGGYNSGCLVLHPSLSAYAKHYPDYNVFSKEPLIDNGYVEHGAGDLTPYAPMLSPLGSTTFPILSLPGGRDD